GQIIEGGPSSRVIAQPQHEYTRALLGAAPSFDWYAASSNGDRP
ncbi:MAG: ABC transporter ATP-binding protein, partial [Chloroflexota bacterium]